MLARLLLHIMTRWITQCIQLGTNLGQRFFWQVRNQVPLPSVYEDGQMAITCYYCSAHTHRSDAKEAHTVKQFQGINDSVNRTSSFHAGEGPVWCPKQFH